MTATSRSESSCRSPRAVDPNNKIATTRSPNMLRTPAANSRSAVAAVPVTGSLDTGLEYITSGFARIPVPDAAASGPVRKSNRSLNARRDQVLSWPIAAKGAVYQLEEFGFPGHGCTVRLDDYPL